MLRKHYIYSSKVLLLFVVLSTKLVGVYLLFICPPETSVFSVYIYYDKVGGSVHQKAHQKRG